MKYWRKIKSVLAVGLIFFSGIVVGSMISASTMLHEITTKAFGSGPVPVRNLLVQHAKDGLRLDDDQQYLFTQVLTETGAELNAATKPVQPQLGEILTRAELRLRQVLRADQQLRFDAWVEQARTRWGASIPERRQAGP